MRLNHVRVFLIILLLLVTILSPLPGAPVWIGGYRYSLSGYDGSNSFSSAEYLEIGLFIEPFNWRVLNPRIALSTQIPLVPSGSEPVWFDLQVEIPLFTFKDNPLDALLRHESDFIPSLQIEAMFNPWASPGVFIVVAAKPFSWFFGDKTVTLLSPRMYWNPHLDYLGWGLRLFEISQFLW
jgi:hypothetical protein